MNILMIDDQSERVDSIAKYSVEMYSDVNFVYSPRFDMDLIEQADIVFLDHDLGYADVYNELRKEDMSNVTAEFIIHSMNPVGARNIANLLESHSVKCHIIPFSLIFSQTS